MDDVHTFHTRSYDKAKEIEPPSPVQRAIVILKLLPSFIVKVLIIIVLELYYRLLPIVQFFVPKKLIDIQGHLAVVSATVVSESKALTFILKINLHHTGNWW